MANFSYPPTPSFSALPALSSKKTPGVQSAHTNRVFKTQITAYASTNVKASPTRRSNIVQRQIYPSSFVKDLDVLQYDDVPEENEEQEQGKDDGEEEEEGEISDTKQSIVHIKQEEHHDDIQEMLRQHSAVNESTAPWHDHPQIARMHTTTMSEQSHNPAWSYAGGTSFEIVVPPWPMPVPPQSNALYVSIPAASTVSAVQLPFKRSRNQNPIDDISNMRKMAQSAVMYLCCSQKLSLAEIVTEGIHENLLKTVFERLRLPLASNEKKLVAKSDDNSAVECTSISFQGKSGMSTEQIVPPHGLVTDQVSQSSGANISLADRISSSQSISKELQQNAQNFRVEEASDHGQSGSTKSKALGNITVSATSITPPGLTLVPGDELAMSRPASQEWFSGVLIDPHIPKEVDSTISTLADRVMPGLSRIIVNSEGYHDQDYIASSDVGDSTPWNSPQTGSSSLFNTGRARKRPVAADFDTEPLPLQQKRKFGDRESALLSRIVIDAVDDNECSGVQMDLLSTKLYPKQGESASVENIGPSKSPPLPKQATITRPNSTDGTNSNISKSLRDTDLQIQLLRKRIQEKENKKKMSTASHNTPPPRRQSNASSPVSTVIGRGTDVGSTSETAIEKAVDFDVEEKPHDLNPEASQITSTLNMFKGMGDGNVSIHTALLDTPGSLKEVNKQSQVDIQPSILTPLLSDGKFRGLKYDGSLQNSRQQAHSPLFEAMNLNHPLHVHPALLSNTPMQMGDSHENEDSDKAGCFTDGHSVEHIGSERASYSCDDDNKAAKYSTGFDDNERDDPKLQQELVRGRELHGEIWLTTIVGDAGNANNDLDNTATLPTNVHTDPSLHIPEGRALKPNPSSIRHETEAPILSLPVDPSYKSGGALWCLSRPIPSVRYEHRLLCYKAFRFHPDYLHTIPDGFRSLTYSNRIDHTRPFCLYETQGGTCNDIDCIWQHFRDIQLSDEQILLDLAAHGHEGATHHQQKTYEHGIYEMLAHLNRAGPQSFDVVANNIVEYRRLSNFH